MIAEIAARCGLDLGVLTSAMAFRQLIEAVPFYEGLTLEEIGGRGVRWPERPQAEAFPKSSAPQPQRDAPESGASSAGSGDDEHPTQAPRNGAHISMGGRGRHGENAGSRLWSIVTSDGRELDARRRTLLPPDLLQG